MELSEKRLEICKKCPLWSETSTGPVCNNGKFINKNGEWSYFPKSGYVKGCGCKLNYKTKNPNAHCIIGL